MANYTAADVKRLRELTGAGMMDCKKALDEADGDFDKAVEFLRIKGAKDVGKRAERATAEGLVAAKDGALIELDSETDFVAKNAEFQALADQIVAAAAATKAGRRRRAAGRQGRRTAPSSRPIADLSAKIGEKLELRRVVDFDGTVATYLHKRAADLPPAVGVLVEYTGDDERGRARRRDADRRAEGRSTSPATRSRRTSSTTSAASPRQTAREEGKPEQALPKIVEGRVNGFFKDVVLLEQPSVPDNKKTVKAAARRGRRDRHPVRPLRGRPGLIAWTPSGSTPAVTDRDGTTRPRAAVRAERPAAASAATPDGTAPPASAGCCSSSPARCSAAARSASTPTSCRRVARADRRGRRARACRSPSSSAAATSSAAPSCTQRGMDRDPRRLHGHARHGDELPCAAGLPGEGTASRPGCRPPSRWARSPSPTSRAGPIRHLEKGRVVIFGAGVGMPYFSTDTTAAQRALEIGAEVVLMAKSASTASTTPTRGSIPDADDVRRDQPPRGARAAVCKVADATAFSLCMDNGMPILVFNLLTDGNIARAVAGEKIGTLVTRPRRTSDARLTEREEQPVIDETLFDAEEKMEKAVSVATDDLGDAPHRPGQPRACSPGSSSTTTARRRRSPSWRRSTSPRPRMAVIKPYDASQLRRDREGDPRLRPRASTRPTTATSSGWSFPQLTEERRRELVKVGRGQGRGRQGRRSATSAARRRTSWTASSRTARPARTTSRRAEKELDKHSPTSYVAPGRRAGQAQGSRAARGLSQTSQRRRPRRGPLPVTASPDVPAPDRPARDLAGSQRRRRPDVRRAPAATSARRSGSGSASGRSSSSRC